MILIQKKLLTLLCSILIFSPLAQGKNLSEKENAIVQSVISDENSALTFLEDLVNVNSGTENIAGVHQVGAMVQAEFEKIGFKSRWAELPESIGRANTLVMTREGGKGKHLLFIGHLDTVFSQKSEFKHFKKEGNFVTGPGVIDDKGGVVTILYALKALNDAHALEGKNITVVLTGDEENSGEPSSVSRKPLIDAAQHADIALEFEPSLHLNTATVARRGTSSWFIRTRGKEAHSSSIFQKDTGYGAIFEMARILNTLQAKFSKEEYLSFNPGLIVGGSTATISEADSTAQGYGKHNVVSQIARAEGDLRFMTPEQKKSAELFISETANNHHLPGTDAKVTFVDDIPAMPPKPGNYQLLELYSQISMDLGYGKVTAVDPAVRGAADISHVATIVPSSLAGLGPVGTGMHTEKERLDIHSLSINTQRAALLIYRLTTSSDNFPKI